VKRTIKTMFDIRGGFTNDVNDYINSLVKNRSHHL
jgi:hypothetical protein